MIRSSLERLISISCAQRSSGIFAIVRSLVTPALWTTTSTPSAKLLGDPLRRVLGGDVEAERLAVDRAGHRAQVVGGLRDVEADDLGAVAGEGVGDRGADPARGAGDQRHLAVERALPVDLRRRRDAGADPDDLAGDVGRAGREQEAQGRVELVLGARGDVDELRGRAAAADLLGQRAGEALQRPLGGVGAGRAGFGRRRAEDDDAAAALQAADRRVEEALQLDQLGRVGDAGGVEDAAPWPCPRLRPVRL